jgi:hypothetical protein
MNLRQTYDKTCDRLATKLTTVCGAPKRALKGMPSELLQSSIAEGSESPCRAIPKELQKDRGSILL